MFMYIDSATWIEMEQFIYRLSHVKGIFMLSLVSELINGYASTLYHEMFILFKEMMFH